MQAHERFYPFVDDFRDPYARDRDRVIHCSSFRRLEYKTQVFINTIGDYFRTRLTHSLEVSQIARSISKNLGLNESLSEVIALSHDLGHTPFGHAGGDELDRILKEKGFKNGFEHNFQSFRVVTNLERRYKNHRGLNLTYATLEGVLKHSAPYHKPFFNDEIEETFKLNYHPSLEAIVVDHADEIAYISHDIDDGIKYKLINYEDLKELELVEEVTQRVHDEGVKSSDKIFRYRFTAQMINTLVYSFLDFSKGHPYGNGKVISSHIPADEVLQFGFSKEMNTKIKKLKKVLFKKLYRHEQISRKMYYGKRCICGLFEAFMDEPELMEREYSERLDQGESAHRVVADYIAGMSDRFAANLYKELYVGE